MNRVRRIACIGECMIELSGWDPATGTARVGFAGDVLNTAVYLARLLRDRDLEICFFSVVGTDGFSDRMVAMWEDEGIDCRFVGRRADRLPGIYAIETDAAGERFFRYWRSESAARTLFAGPGPGPELHELAGFDAIYLSGVTLGVHAPAVREALIECARALRARGGIVAFDSNYRPVLWPDVAAARAAMDPIWAHSTIALAERGFDVVKFFPAEAAGGAATLKAWQAPLPDLRFCPTGGVTGDNAGGYLTLANVACVGGSWIAPAGRVAAADWAGITNLARAATEELTRLRPD